MPQEDRRITFDMNETYKALYALGMQQKLPRMPAGVITSMKIDEKDESIIHFTIENPQDTSKAVKDFTKDFVAAALMRQCASLGIPLPKGGQKSVDFKDDIIVLRVLFKI